MGTNGRCTERGFLEFHHVVRFADGGDTTTANLELRCRAHNVYEADEHVRCTSAQESCSAWTEFERPL